MEAALGLMPCLKHMHNVYILYRTQYTQYINLVSINILGKSGEGNYIAFFSVNQLYNILYIQNT